MINKILKVKEGDVTSAVNSFLKGLLESGSVDAILAPQVVPSQKMVFPVMVSDPQKLDTNVFAPVMPVSTATILSKITRIKSAEKITGIVMRACQLRAAVELVKLKQVNLENILLIGVDCMGTFPANTYSNFPEDMTPTEFLLQGNNPDKHLRSACVVCKDPVPSNADITIGIFGMDRSKELLIQANTEAGENLIKELPDLKNTAEREKAVVEIREGKNRARAKFIEEKSNIKGIDTLAEFFDTCINCHNCMTVCPICYCKECLLESSVFDLEANKYLSKAKNKGPFKMPTDSLLFHVTRMNHMTLSCVQCGLCEQACPNNIPLMDIVIPVADNAQAEFKYDPGRDPEEELPLVVFREDEYQQVGES